MFRLDFYSEVKAHVRNVRQESQQKREVVVVVAKVRDV